MKNRLTALLSALILVSAIANLNADSIYKSDEYGFSVKVPDDWRVYAEMNDPDKGRMIIDWGMPKVYSELEKTEIENAVSITAYKREDIKDIEDLMDFDFKRVEDITLAKSPVESMQGVSYQLLTQRNMQTYSSNCVYFYENEIGYVVNFTATLGTYDLNHPKFKDFVKTIKFFDPAQVESQQTQAPKIRFDGYYVADTDLRKDNECFTYIRFYEDSTVYVKKQAADDSENIAKTFSRDGEFDKRGNFTVNGVEISFSVSSDTSKDNTEIDIEREHYIGKITNNGKLFLEIKPDLGKSYDFFFEFVEDK